MLFRPYLLLLCLHFNSNFAQKSLLGHHHSHGENKFGIAQITYPKHFGVLAQFLLSFALNALDASTLPLLTVTSSANETTAFHKGLKVAAGGPERLRALMHTIRLTTVDLPSIVQQLDPSSVNSVDALPIDKGFHHGKYGTLYICLKKAYAAWYMLEVIGVHTVMVTDSEAYVWKPVSMGELFRQQARENTIWYADEHSGESLDTEPSQLRQNFCSMLPWTGPERWRIRPVNRTGALEDPRRAWLDFLGRMKGRGPRDGEKWAVWRSIVQDLLPSPSCQLMDYMGFFYTKNLFAGYRATVQHAWGLPFLDAVVTAIRSISTCQSDAYWIEVSYYSYLFSKERSRHTFRNATSAARDVFTPDVANASTIMTRLGFRPQGLGLLWWYLENSTLTAFERFYERYPLPIFRSDYRGPSLRRGSRDMQCFSLDLIRRLPTPIGSIQLNSAVPNWLFQEPNCRAKLPNRSLPWVPHRVVT